MAIGSKPPASQKITEANSIVSFAKAISREVASFELADDLNFVGCSIPYVKEKLNLAITDLEWLRRALISIEKTQQLRKKQPGGADHG
jgi:hypothetical protein